jgi:hypothetical protein
MRLQAPWAGLAACLALAGCGGGSTQTDGTNSTGTSTAATATVNLVVADTPATGLTVLSFQIQITGAVLQPGSVSVLAKPVTVDLAQLASDTAFLASTVIGSATYTSLDLTVANPQLTILNDTGATLSVSGQSCAPGATCTFTPALNTATVTISSGVFPLTLTASSTTGLNLDLSIPDLLQSDLSITLADGSSVNLSLLSGNSATAQQATIEDVFGTVTAINGTQVNITTAFGDSLVLTANGSTTYSFPVSVCSPASASCLAAGQVVTTDLKLLGDGTLGVNSLSYVGSSGSPWVKALVLGTDTSGSTPSAQLLIQRQINSPSLSAGQFATAALPAGTSYAVGVASYPQTSAAIFADATSLIPGQELILSVGSDLVTGSAASFNTGTVYLEPSQILGTVVSVDSADASLVIDGLSGLFADQRPVVQQMEVQTDSSTALVGFGSLSAVNALQLVAAKGPLLYDTSAAEPVVEAVQLRARSSGN